MQLQAIEQIMLLDPREVSNCLNDEYFSQEIKRRVFEKSIETFGIVLPVVATPNALGKFTIVDGFKRWRYAIEKKKPLPALIKSLEGDEPALLNVSLNFAREDVDVLKLSKMVKAVSYPASLAAIGFTSKEIVGLRGADPEVLEVSRDLRPDVAITAVKTSITDKKTAKDMAVMARRVGARTKEEAEKLKEKAKEMKFGVHCALCGKLLSEDEKLWLPVCSVDKYMLLEELKEQMYDKQLKDWISGRKCYREEIITVSKAELLRVLSEVPEKCRTEEHIKLIARLEDEMGSIRQPGATD